MPPSISKLALNESNNSEEVITNLIETARTLREADELQSVEFFQKAMMLSRNAGFALGTGECLSELAAIHYSKGDTGQALGLYHEASLIFEKAGLMGKACESMHQLSNICYKIGNYDQALESRLMALHYSKESKDSLLVATCYNKLGEVYKAIGDYEKAIDNHKQSLKISENLKDKELIAMTSFFIGNCYNWWNKLDAAYEHLDESLRLADELNIPAIQVKPTGSLAILFTKLKEYDKSMEYFFRAIDYVNITGDLMLKADLLKSFGNLFIEKQDYVKAIKVLSESLDIAEDINIKYPTNLIHRFLSDAFEKSGDYKNALVHHQKFTHISGELMNEAVALKTKSIQLKYDLEETRKEKELAEKAILHKDQFIANISHEIRTPLNGVLGMSNLLADTNPTAEQLEYINTIKLSANNLIAIINDILDYSKINSGDVQFESSEFNIRELITGIAQVVKVKADEKNIKLAFIFDDQVPEIVVGDRERLSQILLHLFTNAIKFTDSGDVSVDMQMLESKGLTIKLLFTITDTGIGIPEENIHSIFESFKQLTFDNKRIFGGTGLGLSIVKQLVDLQGGSISVNSKVGQGSVFKVELPFKLLTALDKSKRKGGSKSDVTIKDLTLVKILLVEDNKVNQFLAQKLLTKMGFKVEIANNGKEALAILEKSLFDIILMDVQMPEMNGYELTQLIRSSLPSPANQIPIIALTAYASNQEKDKAKSLGMSDYITKPYSPHELLTAILKFVKNDNGVQENGQKDKPYDVTVEDIRLTSEKLIQLFSGSIEDVLSLLHMLVGQIPQLISESAAHIEAKNWSATFQSIHKLKSSINLLKINSLKNSVSELEEFSRDQINTDRIPPVFDEFRKSCEQTVRLIKDEIVRLKKSA
ncbi:MAG: tetratricopeptide repeat protein [Bacteroidota bacterium]|nr:tetratricopeptide repeat protein [Bacteroidota bacterium]